MKILILSSKVPFPPKDGGAIATLSMAEGLSDCGNEICMLCLNTSKHPFNVKNIHSSLKRKIRFEAVNHDTRVIPSKAVFNLLFSREPYNALRFYSKSFERVLVKLLRDLQPDIVQLEGPYMGYYIKAIRETGKFRFSLRAHNVEYEIWQRKALNTRNLLKKFYFNKLALRIKKLEERILRQVDFLVAISERDRMQLLGLHNLPGLTIPAGINEYRYPTPRSPAFPSLFYIGALDWMPNQEGILWFVEQVFEKVKKEIPDIQLHVAGRNAPEWLEEILNAKRGSGILYHGEVDNAYEFMNRYAVFISPLFTGSGIRIKILEGMMMKRAIVATTIAAEGLPVSDRKNIFISDDSEEMAGIITDICHNREKYDEIGETSRKFVLENFNNFATCKRLSDFYRSEEI